MESDAGGATEDGEWRRMGTINDHHCHHRPSLMDRRVETETLQHKPIRGYAGGGKHGGVVTTIMGIMDPKKTTPYA